MHTLNYNQIVSHDESNKMSFKPNFFANFTYYIILGRSCVNRIHSHFSHRISFHIIHSLYIHIYYTYKHITLEKKEKKEKNWVLQRLKVQLAASRVGWQHAMPARRWTSWQRTWVSWWGCCWSPHSKAQTSWCTPYSIPSYPAMTMQNTHQSHTSLACTLKYLIYTHQIYVSWLKLMKLHLIAAERFER